jgi:multiple sugar transport system permease protein
MAYHHGRAEDQDVIKSGWGLILSPTHTFRKECKLSDNKSKGGQVRKANIKEGVKFGSLLVLPAQVYFFSILAFPLVCGIYISLSSWSPLSGGGQKWFMAYRYWTGLNNYWDIIRDKEFLMALARTFIIVATVVPVEFFLGLLISFLFLDKFPGKKIYHTILIMPMMIVPAVSGFIFYMIFQAAGVINGVIGIFIGKSIEIGWLQHNVLAIIAIMLADIWQWTPLMFLILLSGLMSLPEDQLNAATILGFSKWQRFRMIILPLMKPVFIIALIIRGIEAVKIFDPIWIMTSGGPGTATETISVYLYKHGFIFLEWSWIAAAGYIIFALMNIIASFALRPIRELEQEAAVEASTAGAAETSA